MTNATNRSEILAAIDTSDRRIAALVANGEDVRNSPAWRDARDERRIVTLYARLHGHQA